jgi:hypothetical protein
MEMRNHRILAKVKRRESQTNSPLRNSVLELYLSHKKISIDLEKIHIYSPFHSFSVSDLLFGVLPE